MDSIESAKINVKIRYKVHPTIKQHLWRNTNQLNTCRQSIKLTKECDKICRVAISSTYKKPLETSVKE